MAYCSSDDVRARNAAREISDSSKPSTPQVEGFIVDAAAEIDGVLSAQDYVFPITGTIALATLRAINTTGAAYLTEQASVNGHHVQDLRKAWQDALERLSDGQTVLVDAPKDAGTASARSNEAVDPLFSRDMEL